MKNPTEELTPEKNYSINSDFSGSRNIRDGQEIIEFHEKSLHRIWMNEQPDNYESHWHSAIEIIVPTENIYTVEIGGQRHDIQPGEIYFIPPGELHELIAPPTGRRFVYIMNISAISKLKGFSRILTIISKPLSITEESHPGIYAEVYDIMLQIRNEYFTNYEFSELSIQALLLNLFVLIGESYSQIDNPFLGAKPNKQKEYVQLFNETLSYIDEHYTDDITLDFIAAQTGFSKFHFSRLFKQYTNYNFSDYLSFRRIKAAEKLLEKPDYSITDIAIASGFSSISTFNRLFKQQKGYTPSEYRKQNSHIAPNKYGQALPRQ